MHVDITQCDIDAFHSSHFSEEVYAWLYSALEEQQQQRPVAQHNELGFYADGAARSLTDEQIAIFRFSEEQTEQRMEIRKRQAEEMLEDVNQVGRSRQKGSSPLRTQGTTTLPVTSNSSEEVLKVKEWVESMKRSIVRNEASGYMSTQVSQWTGRAKIYGSNETTRMGLLTVCLAGLQFVWSVEQTAGTPYLLSLGLSKAQMSLVWVAGPISGLITQPIAGALSDRSKLKWGRRRPFMVIGAVLTVINLLIIGWTRECVGIFTDAEDTLRTATMWTAIVAVFLLDFAVNAVQAVCRAIIVDTLPTHKQEMGNAWAGRMVASGHLCGYVMGSINLVNFFWWIGDTQLKIICFLSSIGLGAAVAVSCYSVEERVLISEPASKADEKIHWVVFGIWRTISNLPPRVKLLFLIQFCSWLGWFNMLFYSATWVGEVSVRYEGSSLSDSADNVGQITRIGSLALVVFSSVSLVSSVFLPVVVRTDNDDIQQNLTSANPPSDPESYTLFRHLKTLSIEYSDKIAQSLVPYRITLTTAWGCGHILFAFLMLSTLLVTSVRDATIAVGLCGITWALLCWAPFALLSDEIYKMGELQSHGPSMEGEVFELDEEGEDHEDEDNCPVNEQGHKVGDTSLDDEETNTIHINGRPSESGSLFSLQNFSNESNDIAGQMLGIMNIFVTMPQLVMTVFSSIVFAVIDSGRGDHLTDEQIKEHGATSISVVLALGGVGSMFAAYYTFQMRSRYGA